ncbi:MAG: cupin domain-containing protein [Pseudomonadota bacterium]
MEVTRLSGAETYIAPNHFDCSSMRLQGWNASAAQNFWVGLSHFLPGGGCTMEATPLEKVYVVTAGEITVSTSDDEVTLGVMDSCHIPAGEARAVANKTKMPAAMIVVMPYPESFERVAP